MAPYCILSNLIMWDEVSNSSNKDFCVLRNTVEHNYISSSSTLGLQLHVSALYVGHLQVVT